MHIDTIDEGPSLLGIRDVEVAKQTRRKAPAIPMTLFSSALTHYLIKKHDSNIPVSDDLEIEVPSPAQLGHNKYLITVRGGKTSLNQHRQQLQHVTVTAWSRDAKFAHLGASIVDVALSKNIRQRQTSELMKEDKSGLYFIEYSGYYYTLVKGKEALY